VTDVAVTGTPAAMLLQHLPELELQELLPALAEPAEVVSDANHGTCAICNQVDLLLC